MNLNRGFTFVELAVVVAIIAILAALLIPALSAAKAKAQRTICINNLHQISFDVLIYAGDSQDSAPKIAWTTNSDSMGNTAFKKLLETQSMSNLFSCPADSFYFDLRRNTPTAKIYAPEPIHGQSTSSYSSYGFNEGDPTTLGYTTPGIAGMKLSSIKHPARTVLVAELSAYFPWPWHEPKGRTPLFNNAKNMLSFVDGHVSYTKIYFTTNTRKGSELSLFYNPPEGYDYQWSGD